MRDSRHLIGHFRAQPVGKVYLCLTFSAPYFCYDLVAGIGSDAHDPGYARCKFHQYGVLFSATPHAALVRVLIANASRGLSAVNSPRLLVANSAFEFNGFGSQFNDHVQNCSGATIRNSSFTNSLGHGLTVTNSRCAAPPSYTVGVQPPPPTQ
jgi:hypothetical protein